VGPNGSGKSNVAESLRWVLGEQSMKSLRGKRGEDLIFNGSSSSSRQNRASVKLVFDNIDSLTNTLGTSRPFPGIEFDEVSIEREVHRDGTNIYSVNGSQVRLRDIVELLSGVSLGPSGHHIISQGEADRVLSANPKERREILEDALGLKLYQFKISESEKRLDKSKENMKDVEALRREIAPHLKFLKKQVEEAEKVVSMKEELANLATEYFSIEKDYLDSMKEGIASNLHKTKLELSDVESELSKNSKSPRLRELTDALSKLRNEKDEASRAIGRLEGKIEASKHEDLVRVDERGEERCRYCGQVIVRTPRPDLKDLDSKGLALKSEPDTSNYLKEKSELEDRLVRLVKSENEMTDELEALREAEKVSYELRAKETQLRGEIERLKLQEEQYKREHEIFSRDAHEIGMLTMKNVLADSRGHGGEASGRSGGLASGTRETQQDLRKKIERLKIKAEDAGGLGTDVIREFEDTSARDEHLSTELADLTASIESLEKLIRDLTNTLETKFKDGLMLVNKEFTNFFTTLFSGGSAKLGVIELGKPEKIFIEGEELELENEEEEKGKKAGDREWGIDVDVSLPRKKIKGLEMLSGGERSLTSIALIFALSQVNPPPFLVLDETDAALDEANSKRYGDMLTALSSKSQLLVITHNRETMSHAQVLYGVTMGADSISKLLSIRFEEATAFAK